MISNDISRFRPGARIANRAATVKNGHMAADASACMGCGVCVSKCPEGAITLARDRAKGEPLEIQKLIAQAALVAERLGS